MSASTLQALIFDVDGTLLASDRAGRAAFEEYLRRRDELPDGGLNNKSED